MSEVFVPVYKFIRLLNYLEAVGLDIVQLAEQSRFELAALERPDDPSLTVETYTELYKGAVVAMDRLQKPIPWAAGIGSEPFALLCYCLIGARTLGEALTLAQRFSQLIAARLGYSVSLERDSEVARLGFSVVLDPEDSVLLPEPFDRDYHTVSRASGLLIWSDLCGWLIGRSIELAAVEVEAPAIGENYTERMTGSFQCAPKFDSANSQLIFDVSYLDCRLIQSHASLTGFLSNAVYQLITLRGQSASTSAAIKSLLNVDFINGMPSVSDIAEHMHMSVSSLRRRLLKEDTTYQALKDEVRFELAVEWLLAGGKAADIAEKLGFTEASSFIRSFRAWSGQTPKAYQQERRLEG